MNQQQWSKHILLNMSYQAGWAERNVLGLSNFSHKFYTLFNFCRSVVSSIYQYFKASYFSNLVGAGTNRALADWAIFFFFFVIDIVARKNTCLSCTSIHIYLNQISFSFWQWYEVLGCLGKQTGRFRFEICWFWFRNRLPNLFSKSISISSPYWVCGSSSKKLKVPISILESVSISVPVMISEPVL